MVFTWLKKHLTIRMHDPPSHPCPIALLPALEFVKNRSQYSKAQQAWFLAYFLADFKKLCSCFNCFVILGSEQ